MNYPPIIHYGQSRPQDSNNVYRSIYTSFTKKIFTLTINVESTTLQINQLHINQPSLITRLFR